ncbi:MAG: dTDP-4-dehydrorhamnose reductase [Actinomycetota bacterium]|nr:dTDP-4-dehydrorhamnose reductase [Actinomycetota bacterium]
MAHWLVVGSNGQLGHDLMAVLPTTGHTCVGLDLPDIDITDPESVAAALADVAPDVVVNAAAYTAVDAAEADEATALRVNGDGPAVLAAAVAAVPGMRLVQVSTDYVFDGSAAQPYGEDDPINPASAYGRTKAAGELAVLELLPDRGYVVRTAWLYGVNGANFVKTMLRLAGSRDTLEVVDDQRGQPTWSRDLAEQIEVLIAADAPAGIYHGTSGGETTWFGFTRAIFAGAGLDPERVHPTTTDKFPRPAPRPAFSVLGHDKWAEVGLAPLRDWDEALAEALPLIIAAEQTNPH